MRERASQDDVHLDAGKDRPVAEKGKSRAASKVEFLSRRGEAGQA
jgi:hypothetical protein